MDPSFSSSSPWAVVIPSNRQVLASRLAAIPADVPIFVVEDGNEPVRVDRQNVRVFSKEFQRRYMGDAYDLVPRGSAACRNFGFYYLWRETGCRFIVSLDDDVAVREGFLQHYAMLGNEVELETAGGAGWLNTIELFAASPPCYARGFPFDARVRAATEWTLSTARVAVHMGLWDGVLDLHAVDKHLFDEYRAEYPSLSLLRPLVRAGSSTRVTRFPFSSMNFGFVRDALPAMYQIPMRAQFLDRYSLWRYDDIWAGYIVQTLAALRGNACTFGAPVVEHAKAGDLYRELLGEHIGILLSPYVYMVVDYAAVGVRPSTYLDMYGDLLDRILSSAGEWPRACHVPTAYAAFITELAGTLLRWAQLCARNAGRCSS